MAVPDLSLGRPPPCQAPKAAHDCQVLEYGLRLQPGGRAAEHGDRVAAVAWLAPAAGSTGSTPPDQCVTGGCPLRCPVGLEPTRQSPLKYPGRPVDKAADVLQHSYDAHHFSRRDIIR